MTFVKVETKTSTQPIWESSRRPLHPKCIWIESSRASGTMSGGYRHFILDHSLTNPYRSRSDTSSLNDSVYSSFALEKAQSFDIMEDKMNRLSINGSANNCQNDRSPSSLSDHSNMVNCFYAQELQFPNDDDAMDKMEKFNPMTSNMKQISDEIESNNNILADRVLQWLDLADTQSFVTTGRSENIGKIVNASRRRSVTAKESRKRTDLSDETVQRFRIRREAVRQSSITFNDEDSNEKTLQSQNQAIVSIRFGDLFPTTYKCSRKFLALRKPKCADPLESLDLQTSLLLQPRNGKKDTKFGEKRFISSGKGKLKRYEYFEDNYRSMIQRQILETSCNTQAAKRQLHIFIPTLPKKSDIVNESEKSTNLNSAKSGGENDSCFSIQLKSV